MVRVPPTPAIQVVVDRARVEGPVVEDAGYGRQGYGGGGGYQDRPAGYGERPGGYEQRREGYGPGPGYDNAAGGGDYAPGG